MNDVISAMTIQIKISNSFKSTLSDADKSFECLENLNKLKPAPIINSITSNVVPFVSSLFSPFTSEAFLNTKPIKADPKINELLESLNKVVPYILHHVTVLYVPESDIITEEAIYNVKKSSVKFNKFLSKLGSFIEVKGAAESLYIGSLSRTGNNGLFGILWKDQLTQVFLHVNTLLQYTEGKPSMSIKEVLAKDNITIIWNEHIEELNLELLRKLSSKLCIVIEQYSEELYNVKVHNVL